MNESRVSLELSSARHATGRLATLLRVLNSAPLAYLLLVLLQLGAIRGMWSAKDITYGDTSSYYLTAMRWPEQFQVNIAWSPLYTSYFGTIVGLTSDPVQAVLWHRLVMVFAASLLVLAVLRRLLPPGWAWLMAAWWTVLPINFNTLYEVHLFAVLPLLVVWLLLSHASPWARGAALAVLGASVVLVRNEMSVAFALLLLVCLISECVKFRRSQQKWTTRILPLTAAYGLPLLLAAALCLFFYSRSHVQFPHLSQVLKNKHTLNMAQVYACGYQQRHPEWTKSPWTEFHELTTQHFGTSLPSLKQMIASNPAAVCEHFAWNLGLTPSGLQVLLFNATAGETNPDYVPVNLGETWVWIPTALVLSLWIAGLVLLVRNWRFWWHDWLQPRGFVWAGMLAVAAVVPLVICTQRPRPSYLFGLSVMLMACTGMSLFVLAHHLQLPRKLQRLAPLSMMMIVVAVWLSPRLFPYAHSNEPYQRPLAKRVEQLQPYEQIYRDEETNIIQGEYAFEIHSYVGQGKCVSYSYNELRQEWKKDIPLEAFLAERDINAMFLDDNTLTWLELAHAAKASAFLSEQPPPGWRLLGSGDTVGDRWRLYQRQGTELAAREPSEGASGLGLK